MNTPSRRTIPLSTAHIAAANRLYERCDSWQRSDRALESLRSGIPGFGAEATLLKAIAINALYGTKVYSVVPADRHLEKVLSDAALESAGPELVEEMAWLRDDGPEHKERHLRSFASKFAHFFIDAERFPIFDSYADRTLCRHLGEGSTAGKTVAPYVAFAERYDRLAIASGLSGPRRQLDRYLWITGQYHAWCKNKAAPINSEIRSKFEGRADELQSLPTADARKG